ncbi:hypothetical protein E2C01_057119 [Portunus trituberculatus]|uniref:Uncharacterized protein n=1 Tax=Portunus trituberculatus TaxID=210409 RepID=A0A5B7H0Y9_PORTR|nr:hypothetical protein [Portunus trituberculatus]
MDIRKLGLVNKQSTSGRDVKEKKNMIKKGGYGVEMWELRPARTEGSGVAWHDRSSGANFGNLILDLFPAHGRSWEAEAGRCVLFVPTLRPSLVDT